MRNHSYNYDIVIASPNSGIDSYYVLDHLKLMDVNRARRTLHTAGGKGNNMARALVNLGGRALSLSIVGGFAGQFIASELDRETIAHDLVWTRHESRRLSTLFVRGQQDTTVVLEPGQPVGPAAQNELMECIVRHRTDAPYVVLIGSLPPDVPADFYAEAIRRLKDSDAKVGVDCAGEALKLAASAAPALIKVNRNEFWNVFGQADRSLDRDCVQRIYSRFHSQGLETLIITDGPRGAAVYSQQSEPFGVHTAVDAYVSTAGAGDTFIAGLLLALGRGDSIQDAACFASAAAAANIQQLGCGFLDRDQVPYFLTKTDIKRLN